MFGHNDSALVSISPLKIYELPKNSKYYYTYICRNIILLYSKYRNNGCLLKQVAEVYIRTMSLFSAIYLGNGLLGQMPIATK